MGLVTSDCIICMKHLVVHFERSFTDTLLANFSFGYCAKEETFKLKPIGQYGNGFKSGSMRIGKDALVFTKKIDTMSVGLLSQTYLEAIEADTIYLPIVTWDKKTNILCNVLI